MPATAIDFASLINTGGIVGLLALVVWLFLRGDMLPKEIARQLVEANRAALTTADAATHAIETFAAEQKRAIADFAAANRHMCETLDKLLEQQHLMLEADKRLELITARLERLEELAQELIEEAGGTDDITEPVGRGRKL